uniref:Peptidase S1 domain-containing protein n=1 Tax=Timema monikensis TaxID=170555 RepID=A0A7R9E4F3_9NEOP|nr:unnamed protein product [Timema monikensis]
MDATVFMSVVILHALNFVSSSPAHDYSHNAQRNTTQRYRRSGGYPKFPVGTDSGKKEEESECGTRDVYHQPSYSGKPVPKVVGGTAAPYGAYPWTVEIKAYRPNKRKFEHHCGGAVVGPRLVMTAAHCLQNEQADQLRIVVGEHFIEQRDQYEKSFRVEDVLIHPKFRKVGFYSNDIALLKVKPVGDQGIQFNSHVRSICLPEQSTQSKEGAWCLVTGWGAQNPDDVESQSQSLQVAAVSLLDLATCRRSDVYGGRHQDILDSMVCAGVLEGGVDACGGDSGGPLACEVDGRFVLTGLVSWGDGCAKKNRPGVYTRISHYVDWLEQARKQLGV